MLENKDQKKNAPYLDIFQTVYIFYDIQKQTVKRSLLYKKRHRWYSFFHGFEAEVIVIFVKFVNYSGQRILKAVDLKG